MIEKNEEQNEERLILRPLKVGFIKKDFVGNYETNYEEYLTEIINNSKFVNDNGGEKFEKIVEQNKGECDVTNGQYRLDYKLLMDKKTIENMSYYSESIFVHGNGEVSYSASKKTGKCRRYILLNILKNLSKRDLEKINDSERDCLYETHKLVKDYINKIRKDKNILYFIPYELFLENKEKENMLNSIVNKLSSGLKGFLEYRYLYVKDKDTYFSFIFSENMVFLKYDKELRLYDIVPLRKSKLYLKIEDLINPWACLV